MLDFSRLRIEASREVATSPFYPITAEGQAMELIVESGEGHIRPSSGTVNTIFAGFSLAQNMQTTNAVNYESLIAPGAAPFTLTTQFAPDAYVDLLVKDNTGVVWTYNATPGTAQYSLTGNVITLGGVTGAGLVFTVVYRYNMTVVQAIAMCGDQAIGRTAAALLSTCSIVTKGDIFTDQYDTSADWASAVGTTQVLTAGANGRVTLGGTGSNITNQANARLVHAPSSDYPFLGLYINA